jgi:hypothetical protein
LWVSNVQWFVALAKVQALLINDQLETAALGGSRLILKASVKPDANETAQRL